MGFLKEKRREGYSSTFSSATKSSYSPTIEVADETWITPS